MSGPLPGLPDSHMTSHDWTYENIVEAGCVRLRPDGREAGRRRRGAYRLAQRGRR